jgi:hypothetical protein
MRKEPRSVIVASRGALLNYTRRGKVANGDWWRREYSMARDPCSVPGFSARCSLKGPAVGWWLDTRCMALSGAMAEIGILTKTFASKLFWHTWVSTILRARKSKLPT